MHLHMTDSPLEDGTAENLQGVLDQKRGGRFVVQLTKLARLAVNHHGGWLQFLFPCFVWVKYIECHLQLHTFEV